jgi:HEAT repeat protein
MAWILGRSLDVDALAGRQVAWRRWAGRFLPPGGLSLRNRRQRVVVAASVAAAIVVLLGLLAAARGLVVEEWYLWRLGSGDVRTRQEAAARLGELRSSRAVPLLFERLLQQAANARPGFESDAVSPYQNALVMIGAPTLPRLAERLLNGQSAVRMWAARLVGAVAVREIHTVLRDSEDSGRLDPVPRIVAMSIDALAANLGTGDEDVRSEVVDALRSMGPVVVPAMLTALESSGETAAESALLVLVSFPPPEKEVLDAVRSALETRTPPVRAVALRVLGRLAARARSRTEDAAAGAIQEEAAPKGEALPADHPVVEGSPEALRGLLEDAEHAILGSLDDLDPIVRLDLGELPPPAD